MDPIHNTYDWLRYLRRKRRWRPGGPVVLGLRGAELVRGKPSEVGQAPMPEQPVEEQEAPKSRRKNRESQTTE